MLRLRKDQAEEVVVGVVDVAHSDIESSRFRVFQPVTCAQLRQGYRRRVILDAFARRSALMSSNS